MKWRFFLGQDGGKHVQGVKFNCSMKNSKRLGKTSHHACHALHFLHTHVFNSEFMSK
uniref:Uncharacterized protein n=1 Tax=Arundo donax TaxID=35708 RepID=A0A0A9DBS5_ARUDO